VGNKRNVSNLFWSVFLHIDLPLGQNRNSLGMISIKTLLPQVPTFLRGPYPKRNRLVVEVLPVKVAAGKRFYEESREKSPGFLPALVGLTSAH